MNAVIEQVEILVDEWLGCYRGGWKGVIVDGAFAHPAKAAFKLAERIYEHAISEGWIVAGDVVCDPFGGIGGCAFHGLMNGMRVVTCELEEKFVALSKENRELWREQYTGLPGFDADNWIILQGDSRKLASVISEAGIAVSSPPYEGSEVASACKSQHPEGRQATYKRNVGLNGYGDNVTGQLAQESSDTFWSASRTILEQLYSVLTPGAHAIFIVKRFVRNKQIVDFPGQWAQICEAVGFRLIHDHHALLTEKKARQPAMEEIAPQGETWRIVVADQDFSVKRVSFFRRLAEKKGSPPIDYESVLCFLRP